MYGKRGTTSFLLTVLLVVALVQGTAWATDGNLPGGTSISVEITAPPDGALVAYPPGDTTLEGSASIGEGVPLPNTLIVYVLDVSYSTIRGDGGAGCGGDANGDGISDTVLDCEIVAAAGLNSIAAGLGTVGDVGVSVFGEDGAAGDVGPAAGDQWLTGPDTDADASGGPDVEQVLASAYSLGGPTDAGLAQFTSKNVGSNGTNFAAGLSAAVSVASASSKTNKMVVYMSDGLANAGAHVSSVSVPSDVVIYTFAVGSVADCTGDPNLLGSLADISAMGAGTGYCTHVATVADLPDVVPQVVASKLLSLHLSINGAPSIDISGSTADPLPLTGPDSTTFSHGLPGLMPGLYEFCVKATGSDAGGVGSVIDCSDATVANIVLNPAAASNELGHPGQTHTVTAVVAAGADGGVAGVSAEIKIISGPNAGGFTAGSTDSNGELPFTYTAIQGPAGLGIDVLKACFVDDLGFEVCDLARKRWVDTTPPVVSCTETVNPHGKNVPTGQNPDGFFALTAEDPVDPEPRIYLRDLGSGTVYAFDPALLSGTRIKYTQAPGALPHYESMGSGNGQADAIDWHVFGTGDLCVYAVDASGNRSTCATCLVPPPPK